MTGTVINTAPKVFGLLVLAGCGLVSASSPAAASAFCDAQVASYRGELDAKVSPVIGEIDKNIDGLRKGGNNPDNIAIKTQDGSFVTLPQLRDRILSQKAEASREIDEAANKCTSDLKPLQDVTDAGVTIATGGLNKLLPERMTHIEIGEILNGRPFGGDGGLVPHFRDQLLGVFKIDPHNKGFGVGLIVDPWKTLTFQR
jgi:hypothetical protein